MAIFHVRSARCASLGAVLAFAAACGDEHSSNKDDSDASATNSDGGVADAKSDTPSETGGDAATSTSTGGDAGCEATNSCPGLDPLAPFALNCGSLPTDGVCQGGPHEVLLVTEETGAVLMFEPFDGKFIGYFKRPSAEYYVNNNSDYSLFTQGPDQCIWSVSSDDDLQVERWNTDGGYRDKPLKAHQILLSGQAPDYAVQEPLSIAFTRDRVYVGSSSGDPEPRITKWTLDGNFDSVVLDDGTEAYSMEVLGDGSLLIADGNTYTVTRVPATGPRTTVFSAGLDRADQISYEGADSVLVVDYGLGQPVHEVDLTTGVTTTVYPNIQSSSNKYGIQKLGNGHWLLTGGSFEVSSLDPLSVEPVGQYVPVWTSEADPEDHQRPFHQELPSDNFKQVGRACLSDAFIASRATKPADESCMPPPGPAILEEDFETGEFSGSGSARAFKGFTDRGTMGVTSSLVPGVGLGGSRALSISGGFGSRAEGNNTGVHAAIPSSTPKYVSFYFNVSNSTNPDVSEGFFNLSNAEAVRSSDAYTRLLATYANQGWLEVENALASTNLTTLKDQWIHVEMRDIDWTARTYDLYVNCKRLAAGIGIPAGYGDTIDTLDLYNYDEHSDPAVALYDNILIK